MPGRVFVTGGSGFVGGAVIDELVARNYGVNALVNRQPLDAGDQVRSIQGDLFDARALDEGMAGCDAVIHLVGIIMERPRLGITFERIHARGTRGEFMRMEAKWARYRSPPFLFMPYFGRGAFGFGGGGLLQPVYVGDVA